MDSDDSDDDIPLQKKKSPPTVRLHLCCRESLGLACVNPAKICMLDCVGNIIYIHNVLKICGGCVKNAQIRKSVEKILKGANLEEITMKSVCMKVYEQYPDFDLSERKPFIKETVKKVGTQSSLHWPNYQKCCKN